MIPIRLAVIGGRRGGSFRLALSHFVKRVKLTAVCDLDPVVRAAWKKDYPNIVAYSSVEQLLRDGACDAVINSTPMQMHAPISLAALNAGMHVMSEVPACLTEREGRALVQAVRRTGLTFMMGENYTYSRSAMMIRRMAERGVFGELTYAEGMYLHECWSYLYNDDGSLKWSAKLCRDLRGGNSYPTHSIGPIAQWLGVSPVDGSRPSDHFESIVSVSTSPASLVSHTIDRFGKRHPGARATSWRSGDSNSSLIRTARGRVIHLRTDWISPRPHHMTTYELQGTKGVMRTPIDAREGAMVWLEGRTPRAEGHAARQWEPLMKHAHEFEHPRWKKSMATAQKAGHGGGDFFEIEDFFDAIQGRKPNPIDVHTSVLWSSILWLSARAEQSGKAARFSAADATK